VKELSFQPRYLFTIKSLTNHELRRFSIARPPVWNGLPHELQQCNNTLLGFKSRLKTHGQVVPAI